MNREILFRGKRQYTGEWAESVCPLGVMHAGHLCDDFDPATVGQYTGLKDKNGKKIFEGDVIECWSEGVKARGTVQQNLGGLWIIYPAWQKQIMWGLCPNEDRSTDVEIIGNIHDNPELLKGGGADV